MTKQEFIDEIAGYVKKYAKTYGITVYSPIIAQACKESGFGTSELATSKAKNILGIKLKKGRTPIAIGGYNKASGEYYNGVYSTPVSLFACFNNWEECVIGYFQFITSSSRYNCLKGLTNYEEYCNDLQTCGYATSPTYAESLINDYIKKYNLSKYDTNEVSKMSYSNSSLVAYTKISPNRTVNRNHAIDTITIHCVVGQVTAEGLGDIFAKESRKASSNYGVDKNGRVGLYVEEKDRSWCSSNAANDNRAVTIEVASDTSEPYAVTNAAYEGLIKLVADICKRNGIKKLVWSTNKNDRVNHLNGCNMTVHRDYAAKSCPGKYLYDRHQDIASRVNAILGAETTVSVSQSTSASTTAFNYSTTYKTTSNLHMRASANTSAQSLCVIPKGAQVQGDASKITNGWVPVTYNGKSGYSYSEYLTKVQAAASTTTTTTTNTTSTASSGYKTGVYKVIVNALNIRKGPGTNYAVSGCITNKGSYTITQISGNWGKLKSGAGWICIDKAYCQFVK